MHGASIELAAGGGAPAASAERVDLREVLRRKVRTLRAALALTMPLLVLASPLLCFYAFHYLHGYRSGRAATGFIQYDQAYYMACAREFFDGRFALSYGNPSSPSYDTAAIYFQPAFLLLGLVSAVTKLDPGTVYAAFGFVATFVAIALLARIFSALFGLASWREKLTFLCLVWGGGIVAVTGAGTTFVNADGGIDKIFRFDPGKGWWFLNFGRNLVYPTEAFYHCLVLAIVLAFIEKRRTLTLGLFALLSISHPFTGAQFLAIFGSFFVLERVAFKNPEIGWGSIAGVAAISGFHLAYYLVFLPTDPEHHELMTLWALPWNLSFLELFLADALVLLLVLVRLRNRERLLQVFSKPTNRLFAVWFLVSLVLEQHDLFMKPHQPLHFTRGYDWTALFLLGAPTLIRLFQALADHLPRRRALGASAFVVLVFLTDNTLWFLGHFTKPQGLYLDATQAKALDWLERNAPPNALIVSDDDELAYMATVYTPLRAWYSHYANTPGAEKRRVEKERYFTSGIEPDAWKARNLIVIEKGSIRASLREFGGALANAGTDAAAGRADRKQPAPPGTL